MKLLRYGGWMVVRTLQEVKGDMTGLSSEAMKYMHCM